MDGRIDSYDSDFLSLAIGTTFAEQRMKLRMMDDGYGDCRLFLRWHHPCLSLLCAFHRNLGQRRSLIISESLPYNK